MYIHSVYHCYSVHKCTRTCLIKGCGGHLKTMHLTVKYMLNNEVCLTTSVYRIPTSTYVHNMYRLTYGFWGCAGNIPEVVLTQGILLYVYLHVFVGREPLR